MTLLWHSKCQRPPRRVQTLTDWSATWQVSPTWLLQLQDVMTLCSSSVDQSYSHLIPGRDRSLPNAEPTTDFPVHRKIFSIPNLLLSSSHLTFGKHCLVLPQLEDECRAHQCCSVIILTSSSGCSVKCLITTYRVPVSQRKIGLHIHQ